VSGVRYSLIAVVLLLHVASAQECTQAIPISAPGPVTTALQPEALQARSGKLSLRVTGVEQIHTRRLLLLIDRSGSMEGDADIYSHKRKAIQTASRVVEKFLAELPAGISVEYGLFNQQLVLGEGFISNAAALQKSLVETNERLSKSRKRSTAIYDAVLEGVKSFGEVQPSDAILVITDGEDNASRHSAKETEKLLLDLHMRLFVMLVAGHISIPDEIPARAGLIAVAQQSGGVVEMLDAEHPAWGFDQPTEAAARKLRQYMENQVLGGYLLRLAVPVSFNKEQKWSLSVRKDVDSRLKDLTLTYPKRLRPCTVFTVAR
jgi:hypothetical protein